ncbi:MAG: hypothetical protein CMJ81_09885 [Planctomycetaceae bacterium]|nr:hypothetical protein [Planctomycetaceae bacterium]MBP61653.1 hypothetical protein [Planctomycetaceae bacterium]
MDGNYRGALLRDRCFVRDFLRFYNYEDQIRDSADAHRSKRNGFGDIVLHEHDRRGGRQLCHDLAILTHKVVGEPLDYRTGSIGFRYA